MEKVKSVTYNWHQAGSVNDRDSAGRFTVGEKGVNFIIENSPKNGMELWNYEIYVDHKYTYRVFNPNFVEYF